MSYDKLFTIKRMKDGRISVAQKDTHPPTMIILAQQDIDRLLELRKHNPNEMLRVHRYKFESRGTSYTEMKWFTKEEVMRWVPLMIRRRLVHTLIEPPHFWNSSNTILYYTEVFNKQAFRLTSRGAAIADAIQSFLNPAQP
jgi:hypothetical protein